jgi:pyruvyltransferase
VADAARRAADDLAPPPVKLNWCASCGGGRNFGDQLGPLLLRHYGFTVEWAKPAEAEVIAVGSILSKVPSGWRGTVWGTGFIRAGMTKDLSRARVLAVRGRATARACNLPDSVPLGDPGILVIDLPRSGAAFTGPLVIPHTIDHDIEHRHRGATVIRATADPAVILGAIAMSEVVFSSSLHALIAADALGVPHVLELHPNVHGGMFKYRDYASAFGERIRPGVERLTPRPAMAARQAEIRALVERLR